MKKRIQNYLSGNNEGFSLVELIIVIAIMAILIGVVALAVIPNLERSRESKDLSTLDTAASALSVAVANAGAKAGDGSFTITDGTVSGSGTVVDLFKEQADPSTMKLSCSVCTGKDITLTWKTTNGQNECIAQVDDGTLKAKYAKDDAGNEATFKVVGSQKSDE
ncbi:MAG: prepilin-type N-terminal cleavage/methylation domain-containing protein [Eubacterium sp.]|nr:prepilin-type N-terminal cleavage/methylation domain-containing protein [Eubacterium sp.]